MSRYPLPATPDGWYRVASAPELAVGEVRPLHYFGRELVLFRGEDGAARVFDAHCPEKLNCEFINRQFTQDIPIWEHKVYREQPPLTASDGPVAQYRRWFRQFYSTWPDAPE